MPRNLLIVLVSGCMAYSYTIHYGIPVHNTMGDNEYQCTTWHMAQNGSIAIMCSGVLCLLRQTHNQDYQKVGVAHASQRSVNKLATMFARAIHNHVAPVLYVDYLLVIHYVILPCHSYKKCMHVENNQAQLESLKEMSLATRKAGRATHKRQREVAHLFSLPQRMYGG